MPAGGRRQTEDMAARRRLPGERAANARRGAISLRLTSQRAHRQREARSPSYHRGCRPRAATTHDDDVDGLQVASYDYARPPTLSAEHFSRDAK